MEEMTLKEVIGITMRLLNEIPVPVAYNQTIAEPISRAVGNLQACLDGIARAEKGEANGKADTE